MKRFAAALLAAIVALPALADWVGMKAPAFSLPDQSGKVRTLDEFKGRWVVLYFYPKDATPGCTEEAKRFRDQFASFSKQGIVVLGVSLDSVESHKRFADDLKLPFALLSDSQRQLSTKLDVLGGFGPVSYTRRETFLIDPKGEIVTRYKSVDTSQHASQVLADVARLGKAVK
ncbi:peroxiredoxin Q/BCP [Fluviicoccus keumensis]|uniref:thioredoxin-dependent peroxiredoxin n=1 Tax=Fluviicoccus keumensis TaxID=1435465 RepID=A0A4Q7Z4J1_9GAMM|nr:peroxiredoxin [Fluviicoccus keumensis]RZU45302.1 peroxiredoxin Q/BCP [Fluviicoccus keumensis]